MGRHGWSVAGDRFVEHAIASPRLVGRARHLEVLDAALRRAGDGAGQTAVVSGEAGIGKSRLASELMARAAGSGWRVLRTACFEPDRALPYAPFIDLLGDLGTTEPPAAITWSVSAAAPELLALAPELAAWFPPAAPAAALEPALAKRRLFRAVEHLLLDLAGRTPLAVVVEDLHWADDTSLELLQHLARGIGARPCLLLLSYRPEDAPPVLQQLLAGLDRDRLAIEVALPRLTIAETGAMARAILRVEGSIPAPFLDALYWLTEGNPFFVEEVLGTLTPPGAVADAGLWSRMPGRDPTIPRSVRETVRRRAGRLDEAARGILSLAAVTGRTFDFDLLRELSGLGEPELLRLLRPALAAHLLVEESADRLAFRHALTREAICADLLARERSALHRTVAETLERVRAGRLDASVTDLAYHFAEAGVWEKALAYARHAGEAAMAVHAPRAAVEQFTRALDAARSLGQPAPADLLRARGLAHETLGEFDAARDDHEAALRSARAAGDRPAEWEARIQLGMVWASRDYARAGEHFRAALALAQEIGEPTALARSLNRLGNWHINSGEPREARDCHLRALALFEELGHRPGIAETSDLLGIAAYMAGDPGAAAANLQRAAALFEDLGDRRGLASSLATLSGAGGANYHTETVATGRMDAAVAAETAERARRVAAEIGWRPGEAYALRMIAVCLGPAGAYARALEAAQASLDLAEELGHRQWTCAAHCALGELYLDLLALPEARRHLERATALAREMRSGFWAGWAAAHLGATLAAQGDHAGAAFVLDDALSPAAAATMMGQRQVRCARAELALAAGDPARALRMVDELLATVVPVDGERRVPRLLRVRGAALAALGRRDDGRAALEAAEAACVRHGQRSFRWRVLLSLAAVHRDAGRLEEAGAACRAARLLVEELVVGVPPGALRDTFLARAGDLLSSVSSTPVRRDRAMPGGLTDRERQVAACVARGLSNRAIAEELVIAERTAERHVENILGKLDFSSRAQIAAWAVETGLVAGRA